MVSEALSTPTIVTLGEAKMHFRILDNAEDTQIEMVVSAATEKAAQITNRVLGATDFKLYVGDFVQDVELDKSPFNSISKIEYKSSNGNIRELTGYTTIKNMARGTAIVKMVKPDDFESDLTIFYNAGYSPTPAQIKMFILAEALTMFENRHFSDVEGALNSNTKTYYTHLLDSYRLIPIR